MCPFRSAEDCHSGEKGKTDKEEADACRNRFAYDLHEQPILSLIGKLTKPGDFTQVPRTRPNECNRDVAALLLCAPKSSTGTFERQAVTRTTPNISFRPRLYKPSAQGWQPLIEQKVLCCLTLFRWHRPNGYNNLARRGIAVLFGTEIRIQSGVAGVSLQVANEPHRLVHRRIA